jgi:polysaccharide deacetylase family protein (PEP-CTERM system associated)
MEVGIMTEFRGQANQKPSLCLTIDVEDWFHILDSPVVPSIEYWSSLESRIERNVEKLLILLDSFSAKSTWFWLGWLAERHKNLVRKCQAAGHEIACHGYAHILAHEVGEQAFRKDISCSKAILEDIIGEPIRGFRAPGFSVTNKTAWAFDVITEVGYQYDASVFPASRAHGGMPDAIVEPHFIETTNGYLLEIPSSVVEIFGRRMCLFGGGYLRLASKPLIKWGLNRLLAAGKPLVFYVHPREIDPEHPRLPLSLTRRFRSYVRLKSTLSKLEWLCRDYQMCSILEMAESYIKSFYYQAMTLPVVNPRGNHRIIGTDSIVEEKTLADRPIGRLRANFGELNRVVSKVKPQFFRDKLLKVEKAMAAFLGPAIEERSSLEEPKLQITFP